MKTLMVYYSWTGKTRLVAEAIAKTLNVEIREIEYNRDRHLFS